MSYPPAQPPIPPGMAPPMMPPGYGFPPMGMMPMMGMIPPMMRTTAPTNTSATATTAKPSKKLIPQEIPKEADEKPPVTTVFVGNISDRAPDAMVRQMLQRCGNVLSWKRVQGASGKLQAFGFCEYENPEATLSCIRLLNDWKIVDKNLLVKVDAKTKTLLEEYKKRKAAKKAKEVAAKKAEAPEEGEETGKENGDGSNDLDEFTLREDRVAKAGLDAIMREYAEELAKEPPPDLSAEEKKEKRKEKIPSKKDEAKEGIDEMDLDEEDRDLINREINKFRDAHKDEDEKEPDRNRDRERRKRDEEKDRERRERERREREREREREQERREWETREKERDREKYRSRTRSRSRSREASYTRERDRNDRGDRDRGDRNDRNDRKDRNDRNENERDYEDEEEMYERKRMERKMREKEAAYQEKLKAWVTRERKRLREYEKERDKEEDRKAEEAREARRLREFLEDYDDVRDDLKYYKGSALKKRLTEREKEMEADARDRQREKEEIEEIRRRLIDQGHADVEVEMARIEREREEHLIPRLNKTPPHVSPEPEPVKQSPMKPIPQAAPPQPPPQLPPAASISSQGSPSDDDDNNDADDYNSYNLAASQSDEEENSQSFIGPSREDSANSRLGFSGIKFGAAGSASESPEQPNASKRKKLTVGDVFNQDDEQTESSKKRRLVPIDYSEDSNGMASNGSLAKPTTAEEKRKCIKNLIERIPTAKPELFAYELDWSMVDTTLMDRRIKPWVNKKIVEYIGEEEPTLTDFICQKVMAHSPPQNILNDVSMVLDEEAEVFVVKMWRLLIYEIEAKKLGLVK